MKKVLFTFSLLLSGVVCFGQETFIQNYFNGLKGGDIQYVLTDSTITIGGQVAKITLVNTTNIEGAGSIRQFLAPSRFDEFGYEIKNSVTITHNPSLKGDAQYSVIWSQLNTFTKTKTQSVSVYVK